MLYLLLVPVIPYLRLRSLDIAFIMHRSKEEILIVKMIPQIISWEDAIHTNIGQYFWWGVYEPQCTMQNKILCNLHCKCSLNPKGSLEQSLKQQKCCSFRHELQQSSNTADIPLGTYTLAAWSCNFPQVACKKLPNGRYKWDKLYQQALPLLYVE